MLGVRGIILLMAICLFACGAHAATVTVAPDGADFTGIQKAIDHAADNDTILVANGTYTENIVVYKRVRLTAQSFSDPPVVDAMQRGAALYLRAPGISLDGFEVTNASGAPHTEDNPGIFVRADDCLITHTRIHDNRGEGLVIVGSVGNCILGNVITFNGRSGLVLFNASNNLISQNTISDNTLSGIALNSSNNGNELVNNSVINNGGDSIWTYYSNNNTIYLNTFANARRNVGTVHSVNAWNSTTEISYTYRNVSRNSYLGNYWNDYKGIDGDDDGVGDTAYAFVAADGSGRYYTDMFPLQGMWTGITIQPAQAQGEESLHPVVPGEPSVVLLVPVLIVLVVIGVLSTRWLILKRREDSPGPVPEAVPAQGGTTEATPPRSGDFPTSIGRSHHDVFISYAQKDKPVADAICAKLESNNIRCWIAPRDVLPGRNYPEEIIDAIDESRIMVLVFSSNSNNSAHVIREVTRAVGKEVIIIPFRIEEIEPSKSMQYLINVPHWLDALTPPVERHIDTLTEIVQFLLK